MTELYESVVEESNDGIFVARDGEIIYANPKLQRLTGYSRAELVGESKTKLVAPDDKQQVEAYHRARMSDGSAPDKYEVEFETQSGDRIPVELSVSRIDHEGSAAAVTFCRDIGERSKRERELERTQQRFKALFEKAPDAIAIHDAEGEIVDANEQLSDTLGYTREELLSMNVIDFEVAVDATAIREQWATMDIGETLKIEGEHERKDGSTFPVEVWVSKIEFDDEPHFLGLTRDITERRERQNELKDLKERLELAIEGAQLGVWDWDMTTDAVDFNEQWAQMLGYSLDEIDPHVEEWEKRVHPDDLEAVEDALDDHIAGETEYYDTEHRMRTADGDWKWIRDIGKVVERGADGAPVRAVGIHLDIDERKTYQRQLEEERDMFTQGPAVVFKWREASGWPVEHVSENVKDVLGYDAEELTSGAVSFSEIIHEADRERVTQTVMEHSEEGVEQFSHQPYRVVTADGAVRWVLDFTRNVWEDGEIVHRLGYLVDITERRQNERYLQTAQEVADIGWWRKEIPSDRIYWSDRVYDMWGADGERGYLDHEQFLEFIHPEDTDRVDQAWQAALDGEPYDIEHRIITGDGDVRWMREVAEFSYDTDDNPTGAIGIVQDITERKEYEEALEAAREELRQIIDLVPDLVFVKNREGEYLLANEATAEAYGLTPEEVEGKREAEIIPTVEDSEEFRKDDLDVIESGEPKKIPEEELTTADGETRILETTKIPYETSAGGETAVLGYARDVTELKEYEQRLETQRDNLDILNQVVRHDIRNDLQLVLTYGETLEAYVEEDGQEYVQRVLEAAHNAVEITTTARDVTEVMLQSDVDRQPVQLRAALEREVTSVQSSQERALVKVDGSIPAVEVYADDMLESVFRNLLSNAVQHNDKEVPEVTVSATVADGEVVVRVADNGPGIPDERKADIFEQGEMGLDSEGTGLGLYLVDTLVGRYGGEIHVEDNEPDGSVFVVRLPVVSE